MLRNVSSFVSVCAILAASCAPGARPQYGTIRGRTLSVVMGVPGMAGGKPDLHWRPPEPTPVANVLILFLRVDAGGRYNLYCTTSSAAGEYTIELPPADYEIECSTEERANWEEAQGLAANRNNADYKREWLGEVFDYERDDEDGYPVYTGMAAVRIRPGDTVEKDLAAVVLFVD